MKTKRISAIIVTGALLMGSRTLLADHNDDGKIEAAARQSYVYRTYLKDDSIKVQSKEGCVTLRGKVASATHKDLAADTVENLPGVKSVDNQLEVKRKEPADKSDEWIQLRVTSALLYHRSVSGTKTKVSVHDGVVTLAGQASSVAQKELTEEYAKDVEGVKGVKNALVVANEAEEPHRTTREVIDDASITAQVKRDLLTHRSTSALRTEVTTKAGVVSVSGEARSQAEKDLVTKLASDIYGVKKVVNNMEVKQQG